MISHNKVLSTAGSRSSSHTPSGNPDSRLQLTARIAGRASDHA